MAGMAKLLKMVKLESELLGIRLNFSKTKIIAIVPESVEVIIIIDGNAFELVSKFNFLGSLTARDGGCSQETSCRNATFNNVKPVQDLGCHMVRKSL